MAPGDVDHLCLKGSWQNGVCICEKGYTTVFSELALHPLYCNVPLPGLDSEDGHKDILSFVLMALSVAIGVFGVLSLLLFAQCLWSLLSLNKHIQAARQETFTFISENLRRDETNLQCELWELPTNRFVCVNDITAKQKDKKKKTHLNARITYKYKAQDKDELSLGKCGDIITEVVKLENGWCKGQLSGQSGFFPASYVEFLTGK